MQLEPVIKIKGQKKETMMRNLFRDHSKVIELFQEQNIFISEIELEDDLIKALKKVEKCHTKEGFKEKFGKEPIALKEHLKKSKKFNMNDFVNSISFDQNVVEAIYHHSLFKCLSLLVGEGEVK